MKISQQDLDNAYEKVFNEVNQKIFNIEKVQKRIEKFSNDDGNMDLYAATAYVMDESRIYTEAMIYNLFKELFVDDSSK